MPLENAAGVPVRSTRLKNVASFSNLEAVLASEHEAQRQTRLVTPQPQRPMAVNARFLFATEDAGKPRTASLGHAFAELTASEGLRRPGAGIRPSSSGGPRAPARRTSSALQLDSFESAAHDLGRLELNDSGGFISANATSQSESETDMFDSQTSTESAPGIGAQASTTSSVSSSSIGPSAGERVSAIFGQACSDLHSLLSDTSASWLIAGSQDSAMAPSISPDGGVMVISESAGSEAYDAVPDDVAGVFGPTPNELLDNFSPPERLPAPMCGNMPVRPTPAAHFHAPALGAQRSQFGPPGF